MSVNDTLMLAHHVAWIMASGAPLPPSTIVGHTCDVRLCIRNDERGTYTVDGVVYPRYGHLFLTTPLGNARDMIQKGRARKTPVLGEAHGCAKLSEQNIHDIRERYARGGIGTQAIALEYHVSKSQIKRIVRGASWKHLP